MVLYIGLYIIAWLICSVICKGFAFAHIQGVYNMDRKDDLLFSTWWGLLTGLLLFIGIFIAYILSEQGKYGWRLR